MGPILTPLQGATHHLEKPFPPVSEIWAILLVCFGLQVSADMLGRRGERDSQIQNVSLHILARQFKEVATKHCSKCPLGSTVSPLPVTGQHSVWERVANRFCLPSCMCVVAFLHRDRLTQTALPVSLKCAKNLLHPYHHLRHCCVVSLPVHVLRAPSFPKISRCYAGRLKMVAFQTSV